MDLLQQQSAMMAFADVFWLIAVVCLRIAPLVFLMKRTQRGASTLGVH